MYPAIISDDFGMVECSNRSSACLGCSLITKFEILRSSYRQLMIGTFERNTSVGAVNVDSGAAFIDDVHQFYHLNIVRVFWLSLEDRSHSERQVQ